MLIFLSQSRTFQYKMLFVPAQKCLISNNFLYQNIQKCCNCKFLFCFTLNKYSYIYRGVLYRGLSLQSTSEIRTVRFYRIQFLSGCRMVRYSNGIRNPDTMSGFGIASLDRFGMNFFSNKRVQASKTKWPTIRKPDKFIWFSNGLLAILFFYHWKTGHKLCPKNDHSKTGQSGFRMLTLFLFNLLLHF